MIARKLSRSVGYISLLFLAVSTFAQSADINKKRVERGKYIVNTAACHDCHSPKIDAMMTPDPKRLLSGRPMTSAAPKQAENEIRTTLDLTAWAGPWGISYAANLTPDGKTGIGTRYDEAKFIKTMRTGTKPEGEPLLPPMPWMVYKNFNDEDLKSIYAYLRTLPAISNNVKASPPAKK